MLATRPDRLTDFLRQHLQVGHAVVLEQLDAVDAVKAVVLHHVQRGPDGEPLQHRALPCGQVALLPPGVLDPQAQQVVGVRGECRRTALAQFPAAALPVGGGAGGTHGHSRQYTMYTK